MRHTHFFLLLLAIIGLVLTSQPALAATAGEDDPTGWRLRVHGVWIDADGQSSTRFGGQSIATNLDSGGGLGVSAEYRFSRRLGIDFGVAGAADLDVEVRSGGRGGTVTRINSVTFVPYTVGLDVHLTPDSRVDLYVGPLVAYVYYTDYRFNYDFHDPAGEPVRFRFGIENDLAFGAQIGVDVPFGESNWFFSSVLRYLDTSFDSFDFDLDFLDPRTEIEVDPLIVGMGFGYRF